MGLDGIRDSPWSHNARQTFRKPGGSFTPSIFLRFSIRPLQFFPSLTIIFVSSFPGDHPIVLPPFLHVDVFEEGFNINPDDQLVHIFVLDPDLLFNDPDDCIAVLVSDS